jgi:hypothetical protein
VFRGDPHGGEDALPRNGSTVTGLTVEQREKLKAFHDDGLVWLVNTALLHPRGLALMVAFPDPDENDEHPTLPVWLAVTGSDEPWCFAPGEQADVIARYEEAEATRERAWRDRGHGRFSHLSVAELQHLVAGLYSAEGLESSPIIESLTHEVGAALDAAIANDEGEDDAPE